ncbi:alpha/beta fold hydrolase [Actinomadura atramentaria]|uniref:alpha/beta fold hydrolase n=1 Tax=Actinomadura atramentaria TaxID=1990 RepID=UPI0003737FA5|nr:alpha/beta fold hydrolase [Actinomadura atramentaria]
MNVLPSGIAVADTGGDLPPVLCLHGIGSSSAAFAGLARELSDRLRIIAWDAPGYAASADPPAAPGMDGYADAAAGVLDALGLERSLVLGVSFGGVIATRLALRHPDRVTALVLADSTRGSGASPDGGAAMRARGAELAASDPADFARRRAPRLLSAAAPPEAVEAVADAMRAAIRLPGYGHAARAMADTDHGPRLGEVAVPTLVVVGSADVVCPPAESRRLAAGIPGARYAEIPGAGHLANQERPAAFAAAVADFLTSHHSKE